MKRKLQRRQPGKTDNENLYAENEAGNAHSSIGTSNHANPRTHIQRRGWPIRARTPRTLRPSTVTLLLSFTTRVESSHRSLRVSVAMFSHVISVGTLLVEGLEFPEIGDVAGTFAAWADGGSLAGGVTFAVQGEGDGDDEAQEGEG